jgi:uncharacterized protein
LRLSVDKIVHLTGRVVDRLLDDDLVDFKMPEVRLRQGLQGVLEEDLRIEEEISEEAIAKIETYKRDIPYGSDEWKLLFDRFFREIAERRGYVS